MSPIRIMVDLETMGTSPDSAITAIGAVVFDESGVHKTFYRSVSLPSSVAAGMVMYPDTVMWWMRQSEAARQAMLDSPVSLPDALRDFSDWIRAHQLFNDELGSDAVEVWGNGAAFDNVILANAYRLCGIPVPWSFWNDRCYRTLRGLFPDLATPMNEGVGHNALHDAVHQAMCASRMLTELEAMRDAYRAVQQETTP